MATYKNGKNKSKEHLGSGDTSKTPPPKDTTKSGGSTKSTGSLNKKEPKEAKEPKGSTSTRSSGGSYDNTHIDTSKIADQVREKVGKSYQEQAAERAAATRSKESTSSSSSRSSSSRSSSYNRSSTPERSSSSYGSSSGSGSRGSKSTSSLNSKETKAPKQSRAPKSVAEVAESKVKFGSMEKLNTIQTDVNKSSGSSSSSHSSSDKPHRQFKAKQTTDQHVYEIKEVKDSEGKKIKTGNNASKTKDGSLKEGLGKAADVAAKVATAVSLVGAVGNLGDEEKGEQAKKQLEGAATNQVATGATKKHQSKNEIEKQARKSLKSLDPNSKEAEFYRRRLADPKEAIKDDKIVVKKAKAELKALNDNKSLLRSEIADLKLQQSHLNPNMDVDKIYELQQKINAKNKDLSAIKTQARKLNEISKNPLAAGVDKYNALKGVQTEKYTLGELYKAQRAANSAHIRTGMNEATEILKKTKPGQFVDAFLKQRHANGVHLQSGLSQVKDALAETKLGKFAKAYGNQRTANAGHISKALNQVLENNKVGKVLLKYNAQRVTNATHLRGAVGEIKTALENTKVGNVVFNYQKMRLQNSEALSKAFLEKYRIFEQNHLKIFEKKEFNPAKIKTKKTVRTKIKVKTSANVRNLKGGKVFRVVKKTTMPTTKLFSPMADTDPLKVVKPKLTKTTPARSNLKMNFHRRGVKNFKLAPKTATKSFRVKTGSVRSLPGKTLLRKTGMSPHMQRFQRHFFLKKQVGGKGGTILKKLTGRFSKLGGKFSKVFAKFAKGAAKFLLRLGAWGGVVVGVLAIILVMLAFLGIIPMMQNDPKNEDAFLENKTAFNYLMPKRFPNWDMVPNLPDEGFWIDSDAHDGPRNILEALLQVDEAAKEEIRVSQIDQGNKESQRAITQDSINALFETTTTVNLVYQTQTGKYAGYAGAGYTKNTVAFPSILLEHFSGAPDHGYEHPPGDGDVEEMPIEKINDTNIPRLNPYYYMSAFMVNEGEIWFRYIYDAAFAYNGGRFYPIKNFKKTIIYLTKFSFHSKDPKNWEVNEAADVPHANPVWFNKEKKAYYSFWRDKVGLFIHIEEDEDFDYVSDLEGPEISDGGRICGADTDPNTEGVQPCMEIIKTRSISYAYTMTIQQPPDLNFTLYEKFYEEDMGAAGKNFNDFKSDMEAGKPELSAEDAADIDEIVKYNESEEVKTKSDEVSDESSEYLTEKTGFEDTDGDGVISENEEIDQTEYWEDLDRVKTAKIVFTSYDTFLRTIDDFWIGFMNELKREPAVWNIITPHIKKGPTADELADDSIVSRRITLMSKEDAHDMNYDGKVDLSLGKSASDYVTVDAQPGYILGDNSDGTHKWIVYESYFAPKFSFPVISIVGIGAHYTAEPLNIFKLYNFGRSNYFAILYRYYNNFFGNAEAAAIDSQVVGAVPTFNDESSYIVKTEAGLTTSPTPTKQFQKTLTSVQIEGILATIKSQQGELEPKREYLVRSALSLVGKVPYFWGGNTSVKGWDSTWWSLKRITAGGSALQPQGSLQDYGLDCGGFVDWAYNTAGVARPYAGTFNLNNKSTDASLFYKAGDIAFNSDLSHVAIYLYSENGKEYYVHASNANSGVIVSSLSNMTHKKITAANWQGDAPTEVAGANLTGDMTTTTVDQSTNLLNNPAYMNMTLEDAQKIMENYVKQQQE
ncbi:MAG: C40 family peptidase [Clostridiales bacterium]|jgi:hypothetical protein|nr:C40 family peptidase [Clostridiales bacterium]